MLSKDYANNEELSKDTGTRVTGRYLIDRALRALYYIGLCCEIKQERRQLAKLTPAELQDIGLHPADVLAECKRSFLDVPKDRWHRYVKQRSVSCYRNKP